MIILKEILSHFLHELRLMTIIKKRFSGKIYKLIIPDVETHLTFFFLCKKLLNVHLVLWYI